MKHNHYTSKSKCSAAEGFDDIEIDSLGELPSSNVPRNPSLNYLYKKNKSVVHIDDSNYRSTTSLMNNHSHDNLPQRYSPQKVLPKAADEVSHQSGASTITSKPNYSPSKKLHKKREIPKDDEYQMFDNDSEDDLDDTILIYDVPLSQSLVQLATHQKPIQQPSNTRLHSLASDTTHTSSILSSSQYSLTSSISDTDMDSYSFIDPKAIGLEMSRSKSVLTIQESTMRRHLIANFDNLRPKSMDNALPSSETKEKFLTPTRQLDLPPKNKEEAIKHLKAFQNIKTRAIKMELQNEKKTLKELSKRQLQQSKDLILWERKVIPNFTQQIQLSETRELWWRGIPSKLRQFIWMEQLGVELPSGYFNSLKRQAEQLIQSQGELINKVHEDIRSIFPDLRIFQATKFKDLELLIVMHSIHSHYDSGISSLVAVLLHNINDIESTFACLLGLLQRNVLKLLYRDDEDGFNIEAESFLRTFAKKQPELYHHLNSKLKLKPWEYLVPLLKPVFSRHLSIEVVSSILDVYIFEGDAILWRCVLGLFNKIGYKLYGNKDEVLGVIGWDGLKKLNKGTGDWYRYLDVGDDIEFMTTVRGVLKKNQ